METNDEILKRIFKTNTLDVYFYENMIKAMNEAKKEEAKDIFDEIKKSKVDNFGNCGCIKIIEQLKQRHTPTESNSKAMDKEE